MVVQVCFAKLIYTSVMATLMQRGICRCQINTCCLLGQRIFTGPSFYNHILHTLRRHTCRDEYAGIGLAYSDLFPVKNVRRNVKQENATMTPHMLHILRSLCRKNGKKCDNKWPNYKVVMRYHSIFFRNVLEAVNSNVVVYSQIKLS